VGVGVGVDVGVLVVVGVRVGVLLAVGVLVGVAVAVGELMAVFDGVLVAVLVTVAVAVGVGVGVETHSLPDRDTISTKVPDLVATRMGCEESTEPGTVYVKISNWPFFGPSPMVWKLMLKKGLLVVFSILY
jgi:hypothetical protein